MSIVRSPNKSTRRMAAQNQWSQTSTVRLIKEAGLRDYKATFVQNLSAQDMLDRQTFAMEILDMFEADPTAEDHLLWTD